VGALVIQDPGTVNNQVKGNFIGTEFAAQWQYGHWVILMVFSLVGRSE